MFCWCIQLLGLKSLREAYAPDPESLARSFIKGAVRSGHEHARYKANVKKVVNQPILWQAKEAGPKTCVQLAVVWYARGMPRAS